MFLEAIRLVNVQLGYEAFYAVILGSDQGRDLYKKKLVRLTEQYRLTKQVKFIDHCKDMALAYKISDIVISSSIEPESFGRVSVEAQSMKKIIIASNIGGSNETVIDEKSGYLFESGDVDALVRSVCSVVDKSEQEYWEMSKKAVASSKEFDSELVNQLLTEKIASIRATDI